MLFALLTLCHAPTFAADLPANGGFEDGGASLATGWRTDVRKGDYEFEKHKPACFAHQWCASPEPANWRVIN